MPVNKVGADWVIMRQWCITEIDAERNALETIRPEEYHHMSRGRIDALRKLIDFVEPSMTPETEEVNYG